MTDPEPKTTMASRQELLLKIYGKQTGMIPKATLVVESGPDKGVRFQVAAWESTIGWGEGNNFPLTDKTVSTDHAVIRCYEKGCVIVDQDSKNGTRVNGKEIFHKLLKDKDQITIGSTLLRFRDPKHR